MFPHLLICLSLSYLAQFKRNSNDFPQNLQNMKSTYISCQICGHEKIGLYPDILRVLPVCTQELHLVHQTREGAAVS